MSVKVKKCTCTHEYQDKKYGNKMRVMNSQDGKGIGKYKCTVCDKIV